MAAKSANPTRPGRCEGEERKKALSVALANIEKQFGKGAIMRMADGAEVEDIETVSTGSWALTLRSAWAVCPAVASSRCSVPNPPARRRSPAGHRRNAEDRRYVRLH